jgi:hypothetical protein
MITCQQARLSGQHAALHQLCRLAIWHDPDEIICEIRDGGVITEPLAGRRRRHRRPGEAFDREARTTYRTVPGVRVA